MKLAGTTLRLELLPENDGDKQVLQDILKREHTISQILNYNHPFIYWGDSDEDGGRGALIISSHKVSSGGVSTPPEGVEKEL